jgi:hypothetical protein
VLQPPQAPPPDYSEHVLMWFIVENTCLIPRRRVIPHGTTPNHLFPVRSKKVKKGSLRSCARLNLRLVAKLQRPRMAPTETCFNVQTPLSLIFEPLVPARLGVTRYRTVNIQRTITADIIVPTYACANRVFARYRCPFHPKLWAQ